MGLQRNTSRKSRRVNSGDLTHKYPLQLEACDALRNAKNFSPPTKDILFMTNRTQQLPAAFYWVEQLQ